MQTAKEGGPRKAQASFEYVLLLGIILFLVVFGIIIMRDTGIVNIGWEINSTIAQALPFINSSSLNATLVTVNPIRVTPPPAPTPTPTVTPLPPARLISSCKVIVSPGYYRLAKDLESNSTCISIVSRDVLVDCAGNSITGVGPVGAANAIYAVSVSNAVAKNCVIRNYSAGAYFDSCEFCALENSTTEGSDKGVWFRNSPHSRAFMVNASENGIGIFFQHSNGFNATANLASGNADGFKFESASSGTIESNVAANNSGNGFYFFESSQNAIRNNLAYGNAEGFRLTSYSNDNWFSANNATQNAGNGFFFGPSVGNSFAGSRACGNGKNLACVYVQKDGGNNTCGALGAEVSCLSSVYCLGC